MPVKIKFRQITLLTIILVLILSLRIDQAHATPAGLAAQDVLAAVNALRQSQGLAPYTTDSSIAAYAQQHSEYQAGIGQWTHTHFDGSSAGSRGYVENIAAGNADFLTAQSIVYEIWADAIHMKTMIGYSSGAAGVGVALGGSTLYVTLNVRAGKAAPVPTLPGGTPGTGLVFTPIALVPLSTATPKENGAVIHDVGYGQSMWAIAVAYGITGDRIRELNSMAPGQTDIYAGQKLLIVPAGAVAPVLQVQPTPLPTDFQPPQMMAMVASPSPRPTATPVQALTAPPPPAVAVRSRARFDPVLAGLAGAAMLGLALLIGSGVKIKRRN